MHEPVVEIEVSSRCKGETGARRDDDPLTISTDAGPAGVARFRGPPGTSGTPVRPRRRGRTAAAGLQLCLPSPPLVTWNLFVTNGAGAASTPFAGPAGFPGVLLVFQAAALDATPTVFTRSNAGIACPQ